MLAASLAGGAGTPLTMMTNPTRKIMMAAVVALSLIWATPAVAATTPRGALLDRINESRAAHGLAAVAPAPALHTAAMHHTDDMLVRDYFAHTSPVGSTVYDRIVRSGFVSGYSWTGGETLAWGTGSLRTARATVQAWLASPDHRAILLSSRFRWVGIARSCGNFMGHAGACVWTTDWVVRS
jgi:uncharacterized protein YkwD